VSRPSDPNSEVDVVNVEVEDGTVVPVDVIGVNVSDITVSDVSVSVALLENADTVATTTKRTRSAIPLADMFPVCSTPFFIIG